MKRLPLLVATLVITVALSALSAQTLSSKRLERVDRYFQEQVDQERIAGAVTLDLQDGKTVYEHAFGWADKEARRKMTTDAIFRIASQSKALTSAVILSLMEEGKLALTDPAGRYIPTFARTTVHASGAGMDATTVPAKRPITIRDLLTHTAGVSYGEESRIAEQPEFRKLRIAGAKLARRQGVEQCGVGDYEDRLMEGTDEVLAVFGVDCGLAADR